MDDTALFYDDVVNDDVVIIQDRLYWNILWIRSRLDDCVNVRFWSELACKSYNVSDR